MQCPFCIFLVFSCCLEGFHLRIDLNLQKHALFIYTARIPCLSGTCSELCSQVEIKVSITSNLLKSGFSQAEIRLD